MDQQTRCAQMASRISYAKYVESSEVGRENEKIKEGRPPMRIIQILLAVFLVLYATNIYVNRPSVPRYVRVVVNGRMEITTPVHEPIEVMLDR